MSESDRQTLLQIPARFALGWNRRDAWAAFSDYCDDAEFVNVFGTRWRGKEAMVQAHSALFAGIFAESSLTFRDVNIRQTGTNAALVQTAWTMKGHQNPDGRWLPVRAGILTFVAEKNADGWHVVFSQNTDILEAPG